jgi:hypothetical protein
MNRLLLLALCATLAANAAVLTFEGLANVETVGSYYDGGLGGNGSGPGPDFDITFAPDALALVDADAGGSGNIANEPSGETVLFFLTGPGAIMNVPGGFTTGFSFFYAAPYFPGTVTVWDDLNGTGNLLATIPLVINTDTCGGDPSGQYNCWTPIGAAFAGTAKSVNFSGTANYIVFDDVTLGSATPGIVPEPAAFLFAGGGVLALFLRRKFAK